MSIHGPLVSFTKVNAIFVLTLFFSFSVEGSGTASSFDQQIPAQLESLESRAAAGNEKAQMKLASLYWANAMSRSAAKR